MKRSILIILILIGGVAMLAYPYISNYLTERNGSDAIQEFKEQLAEQPDEELNAQRTLAEAYNASLAGQVLKDPFLEGSGYAQPENYNEILDFANHMMGYIEIPKIDVYLPIYHGVADAVLAKGVGHLSQTAFPIGGEGNHSVLSGHTALSSAKLFTDLTELKEADTFYIHILGETLAYQVDQIKIVKPDQTEEMLPVAGEDYVTLITCTPYAVNTHRLLVRGTRIPYTEESYKEDVENGGLTLSGIDYRALISGAVTALLMLVIIILAVRWKRRRNQS